MANFTILIKGKCPICCVSFYFLKTLSEKKPSRSFSKFFILTIVFGKEFESINLIPYKLKEKIKEKELKEEEEAS